MTGTPSLLYAHGFISSPDSAKVHLLRNYLQAHYPRAQLQVPALSPKPREAMATLEAALQELPAPVVLVGSSMGGFYSAHLANRHGLRAWLVNPLARVAPYASDYLGDHIHAYTGESFCITEDDAQYLRSLEVPTFQQPGQVLLSVQTGDETLDYRHAVQAWPDIPRVVSYGGNHHFMGFDQWLPFGLRFLGFQ